MASTPSEPENPASPGVPAVSLTTLPVVAPDPLQSVVRLNAPITPTEYCGLQQALDHFNAALFENELPDVLLTYQRKANSAGYFCPYRFAGRIDNASQHELALNPDVFADRTDEQICQTLVHEMSHVWQQAFGKPSPGGYHNQEWAAKMKSIGLMPSSTGMPGGKQTGPRMMDFVIPDGAFARAYASLAAAGWRMNLESAYRLKSKTADNSKTKFTCPACGCNAWGKADLDLACVPCGAQLERSPQ